MIRRNGILSKNRLAAFFNKNTIILTLILMAAAFIRIYSLSSIPVGFHRDEAFFGYEAYSLIKTARDSHGRFLPFSFEGFGIIDYPLAIYPAVPIIALLGLDVFAIRFNFVVYSLITIYLVYKLSQKFLQSSKVALVAAVILTFSSWHFYLSRTGWAISMYALVFLLWGIWWLLYGTSLGKRIAGGAFLGLTLFTYAAYYFFLPPFLFLIFLVYFPELRKNRDFRMGLGAAVLTSVLAFSLFFGNNLKRAPQAAFWYNNPGIRWEWSDKPVGEVLAQGRKYDFLEMRLHDPRLAIFYKAVQNYFDGFSVTYWLRTGRGFESNLQGFGNLLLYEPLLILAGIIYLAWQRSKAGIFLVGWLLLGPLATTFTKDVTTARLLHMLPAFVILEATGVQFIYKFVLKFKQKVVVVLVFLAIALPILFNNVLYFDAYFRHSGAYMGRWWYRGYLDVVDLLNTYPEKKAYLKTKGDFAYTFIVFRNQYDPVKFQREAVWETNQLNISEVTRFGRYVFIDTINLDDLCRDFESIYIEKLEENVNDTFQADGEIAYVGSDRFIYFVPTPEKCAAKTYLPLKTKLLEN